MLKNMMVIRRVICRSSLFFIMLFMSCASTEPVFDENAWLERINAVDPSLIYADHRNEKGVFFNPWMSRSEERRGSFLFRKKMRFGDFPAGQYAPLDNSYPYLADPAFDSISFVDHASFIIKIDGETIISDPFYSKRAFIVPKKIKIPFDFSRLPDNPVVLISHNHYDHLDKWTVKRLIKKGAVFIVPLELKNFFVKLKAKEVHELDWWQSITIGPVAYTLLPAQHWSRRLNQADNAALWGSYMIEASKTIYFSGDSGYFAGFKEFGRRWEVDYAIIGAGAYEPRWFMHYSHMNVAEFLRAAGDLNAKISIPMHFGTISLSDEPLVYTLYEIDKYLAENPQEASRICPLRVGGHFRIE